MLLTGQTGTAKTTIVKNFIHELPSRLYISLISMFSARTNSNEVQDSIDSKLTRRKKGVFGPEANKKLMIFIDDLNMPAKERFSAQPAIELLRQAIDSRQ